MKKYFLAFLSAIMLVLIVGCEPNEPQVVVAGKVSFSFTSETEAGGRTKSTPVPAFVSYSLGKSDGSTINNKIELIAFNDSYVTQPQTLNSGEYQLKEFMILDADNKAIYASPLAGSPLADLVEHPLPLSFTISADETTSVVPEVLALEDYAPEDFGYVAFGYEVVAAGAIRLPLLPEAETLIKISYQFSNTNTTIASEITPPMASHVLNLPELLGQTWHATITIWTSIECHKKIYRLNKEMTFNGSVKVLPPIGNTGWTTFYYSEHENIKILRSIEDGKPYRVEIQLPSGTHISAGYVDRGYWDLEGNPLCDMQFHDIYGGSGVIQISFPEISCEINESHYAIDSFMHFNIGTLANPHIIQDYFSWEIIDGLAKPDPCTSSGGRTTAHSNRKRSFGN